MPEQPYYPEIDPSGVRTLGAMKYGEYLWIWCKHCHTGTELKAEQIAELVDRFGSEKRINELKRNHFYCRRCHETAGRILRPQRVEVRTAMKPSQARGDITQREYYRIRMRARSSRSA